MVNSVKKSNRKPMVILVILDGWGIDKIGKHNAIALAKKPNFDRIQRDFGSTKVCASGECVGLTPGQMGNSEVGHLTIGAGRIIFQDLMRVSDEINSGRLENNRTLLSALERLSRKNGKLHFLGLASEGGVHSHLDHLKGLVRIARKRFKGEIVIHAFLDGRDTPPRSGRGYADHLLHSLKDASIGTIIGRYYSMDRDNRWDRTKLAFEAIVYAKGRKFDNPISYITDSYASGVTDEFVVPGVNSSYKGMHTGDLAIFFNFRPDRARQLTRALSDSKKDFGNTFDRMSAKFPKVELISMTVYDTRFRNVKSLLPREHVPETLSNILERRKIRQMHIAETEKYAHVTYFFNGLVEKPRKLEKRVMVPSLKIGTYDKKPTMSASGVAREAVNAIRSGRYGFILVNFANADMVGHSGKLRPTIKAVETVDKCLGLLLKAWEKEAAHTTMIVTADHGNAEKMYSVKTGQPHTAHTSSLVPLILVSKSWKLTETSKAGLIDITPTILKILGISKPKVMTGKPIVQEII